MAHEVDWIVAADAFHEPAYFHAIWEEGDWRVFRRFGFEVRWHEEDATPEMVKRANREAENSLLPQAEVRKGQGSLTWDGRVWHQRPLAAVRRTE
jgi:hypothetical protein